MSSGNFSFCGVNISSLGLEYAPELADTFVYRPASSKTQIETFDGHNGGYYYGSWHEPKEFVLRCVFEENNIDKGIMSRVYALFKVGRTGKLVFDRRPWCYYYATVTEPVQEDFTNYLNGLITIKMQAMYPYARSEIMTHSIPGADHEMLMANTAVFEKPGMELSLEYTLTQKTQSPILLANPGTERAGLAISISGDVGSGIIITNETTGQKCKMVAITKQKTTNVNKRVLVDSINGKTILSGAGTSELAFMFHEYGFLELEPAFPAIRNLFVSYDNSNVISVANILTDDVIGKYIFVNNKWEKIVSQPDKHSLTVSEPISGSGHEKTMITMLNEITVNPITTMDVDLQFIYKPTYA